MLNIIPKASAPSLVDENTTTGPLTLYYIAIDDGGKSGEKVGCGDSAVMVKTEDVKTDNVVSSTFSRLLSNHNQFYGESGLYNVLYNSNLTFLSSFKAGDTITVNLSGELSLGGVCDNPRVQSMLEMTAKTAAGATKANIFINSKPLSEVLSLK
ncbi:hypothetical protein GW791_03270 [Candidatus Saccharibacteria bacterium]|nr:hypothetical protein [Candidatus Saccharibacteria bacterium]